MFFKYYNFNFNNTLKDIITMQKQIHGNNTKDYMNMKIDEYFNFLEALSSINKAEIEKNK